LPKKLELVEQEVCDIVTSDRLVAVAIGECLAVIADSFV
jgi:hypothetical protein